jgi:uncharacterized RmlC-like cupin family protein
MKMTNGIKIIHPDERSTATAQTSGMRREAAISPELTGSQTIWVGLVTTPAGMNGGWHHHGDCESAIYVVSGRGRFRWGLNGEHVAEVSAGDFLSVPPNEIHHEEAIGDEPFVMVVARGCSNTITVNVEGPQT